MILMKGVMMKRILLWVAIATIILSLISVFSLVGCKKEKITEEEAVEGAEEAVEGEAAPAEETEMSLTLGLATSQIEWWNDIFVLKKTAEATGIDIEVRPIPAGDVAAKRSTMIASKTLPDLMFNPDAEAYRTIMSMGLEGVYYPIDTILDKIPNFKRWADKYPEFYDLMTDGDGHIYALPRINDFKLFDWGLVIRADLLEGEEITAGEIETIEDLYKALTIIKEKKGNAPIIARSEGGGPNRFLPMAVQIFGTGLNSYYNHEMDAYSFGPMEDNFYKMVEWLNKFYEEGLINKDIFTMSDDVYSELQASDKGYFFMDNMASIMWAGPEGADWQVILPPEIDGKRYYGTINKGSVDYTQLWTIPAQTENIDAVAKLIDYAYSDEGIETWIWGEEGYTFTKDEEGIYTFIFNEDGWPYLTIDEPIHVYDLGIFHSDWNVFVWTENIFDMTWLYTEEFKEARNMYMENGVVPDISLPVMFTSEEDDQRIPLEQPINTYTDEMVINFITGVKPLDEWDSFKDELEGMGVNDLIEIYNTAFTRIDK